MRFEMQCFLVASDGALTQVAGEAFDAANDCAAVDAARAYQEKVVPAVGGEFEIVVAALDPGVSELVRDAKTGAYVPRAPGEISRCRVSHEPQESVRDEVYAKRDAEAAAKSAADARAEMRAELLAEIAAEKVKQ